MQEELSIQNSTTHSTNRDPYCDFSDTEKERCITGPGEAEECFPGDIFLTSHAMEVGLWDKNRKHN